MVTARWDAVDEAGLSEMVDDDVPQSQIDSWASTNCSRSGGTQMTSLNFDFSMQSVSCIHNLSAARAVLINGIIGMKEHR